MWRAQGTTGIAPKSGRRSVRSTRSLTRMPFQWSMTRPARWRQDQRQKQVAHLRDRRAPRGRRLRGHTKEG